MSNITPISRIASIAARKVLAGDWTRVSISLGTEVNLLMFLGIPVVLSERITENVNMCEIRSEIYGASDHVPVVMEIDSGQVTGNQGSSELS